jgi:glucokinase
MARILVGVDLGGTNVRVGAVTPAGELLDWKISPIEAANGPQAGVAKIAGMIEALLGSLPPAELAGIGIGSTGPIDRGRGAIQNPYTLPSWVDVDIASPLSARFAAPVILENDADAAAFGEAWAGAGRGMRRMAMVTVGTGIGTALILDGKIYRGMDGIHPEGGHMLIDPAGPECYCGAHGCWESLVAGPGIARLASAGAAKEGGAMLEMADGDPARVDARILVRAARQKDPTAVRAAEQVAFYLGLGLANIILLTLPDGIVLGGGVMAEYDLFAPGVRAVLDRHNSMVPASRVQILTAQLAGKSGVLGAARAALSELEEHN